MSGDYFERHEVYKDTSQSPAMTENVMACPACSSTMRQRRANKGAHAGKLFRVCMDYPQCANIIPVGEAPHAA